jgi:hypothetical protein
MFERTLRNNLPETSFFLFGPSEMIPASTVNETHQRSTPRVLLTVMLPPESSGRGSNDRRP